MTNAHSGAQVPPGRLADEVSRVRQFIMGFRITQLQNR